MQFDPERFLQFAYPETRDLLKAFLTLSSGVLVLSVAFSEKIARTHEANPYVRRSMLMCWFYLFASIVLAGAGIFLNAVAAACAIEENAIFATCSAPIYAMIAWGVGMLGGLAFTAGIGCMALTAKRAMALDTK